MAASLILFPCPLADNLEDVLVSVDIVHVKSIANCRLVYSRCMQDKVQMQMLVQCASSCAGVGANAVAGVFTGTSAGEHLNACVCTLFR